jgi:hypothetical protein
MVREAIGAGNDALETPRYFADEDGCPHERSAFYVAEGHRAILRRLLDSGFLEAAMRSEAIKNECAERPMYPDEPPQARYDLEGQAAGECSAAYCRLMAQPTEGDHA